MQNRYKNTDIVKDDNNKRYYVTTLYPKINRKLSDIYIISKKGDRLDLYAQQFYGDSRLWTIIAQANNIGKGTLIVETGIQIRIPTDIQGFETDMEKINEDR